MPSPSPSSSAPTTSRLRLIRSQCSPRSPVVAGRTLPARFPPGMWVVSPFPVDIAVRAAVGPVDWHPDRELLRYRRTPRSVDLFPGA